MQAADPGGGVGAGRSLAAAARRLRPRLAKGGGGALPRLWLFGDPARLPDPRAAAARLPRGAAVVARGLAPEVLAGLARLARRRGLRLLLGGEDAATALGLGAGLHMPDRPPGSGLLPLLLARRGRRGGAGPLLSVAAHGRAGLVRARRLGADAAILSPAFPTRSHPGAPSLGPLRWAALARAVRGGPPVVALGGVDGRGAARLPRAVVAGFAAIGALAGARSGGGVASAPR